MLISQNEPTMQATTLAVNSILHKVKLMLKQLTPCLYIQPMNDDAFYPIYLTIDNVIDAVMKKE